MHTMNIQLLFISVFLLFSTVTCATDRYQVVKGWMRLLANALNDPKWAVRIEEPMIAVSTSASTVRTEKLLDLLTQVWKGTLAENTTVIDLTHPKFLDTVVDTTIYLIIDQQSTTRVRINETLGVCGIDVSNETASTPPPTLYNELWMAMEHFTYLTNNGNINTEKLNLFKVSVNETSPIKTVPGKKNKVMEPAFQVFLGAVKYPVRIVPCTDDDICYAIFFWKPTFKEEDWKFYHLKLCYFEPEKNEAAATSLIQEALEHANKKTTCTIPTFTSGCAAVDHCFPWLFRDGSCPSSLFDRIGSALNGTSSEDVHTILDEAEKCLPLSHPGWELV